MGPMWQGVSDFNRLARISCMVQARSVAVDTEPESMLNEVGWTSAKIPHQGITCQVPHAGQRAVVHGIPAAAWNTFCTKLPRAC